MANVVYPLYKKALLDGTIAVTNSLAQGTVKASLVDTTVTPYDIAHDFYSDISAAVVATSPALTSKTVAADGTFDAVDALFTAVATGGPYEAIVLWVDTGTPTTSPLVAFIDTAGATLPVTANGGNITVQWSASGIFTL